MVGGSVGDRDSVSIAGKGGLNGSRRHFLLDNGAPTGGFGAGGKTVLRDMGTSPLLGAAAEVGAEGEAKHRPTAGAEAGAAGCLAHGKEVTGPQWQ